MPEKLSGRVDTLEKSMKRAFNAIDRLAENQNKFDELLVTLTESQIRLHESQIKTEESLRHLDDRIENLVSAIGSLITERNGGRK